MKIVSFSTFEGKHIGVIRDEKIISLTAISPVEFPPCVKTFIQGGKELQQHAEQLVEQNVDKDVVFDISHVKILPPITQPEKIICVGLNYLDHCAETGMEPPASPVIFSKYANAIIGHNDAVEIPINSNEVDFEAELVVVIGQEAKCVSEEEAMTMSSVIRL